MAKGFDKNGAGNDASRKQWILLGVLGVMFLGAMYYFYNHSVATAAAAGTDNPAGGDAVLVVERSPSEALQDLKYDPTARLLLDNGTASGDLDNPPTNPFVLSRAWAATLVKVDPRTLPDVHGRTTAPVAAVNTEGLKVQAIFQEQNQRHAFVNNTIVKIGTIIDGFKVVDIKADKVICVQVGNPKGGTVELLLHKDKDK